MAAVVLQGLSKRYPTGTLALRDLDLTVASGELLVVVGPSGCGKTTLLRLIAGLETPTSGRVLIGDRDVTGRPPRERNVALVFQRPPLYPHLTVRDNLAFAERLRSWRRGRDLDERIDHAARMLDLETVLDRLPAELSGGQQQRVAVGRAVVRRPAVFLLDEPLSSLDPPLRTGLRRQLHLLPQALSATMVYVTHDQTEALTLGDRVAVLDEGALQQVATPADLHDRPANRFVASFVGGCQPAMNFLDGGLDDGDWVCGLGRMALSPRRAESWSQFRGRELTAGLRPERIVLAGRPGGLEFEAVWTEVGGGATLVQLQREGTSLTAWTTEGVSRRQTVKVVLDMDQAHLFDRKTGQALAHPETG
jgi:multiple sugar transport system ATP-binding protein